VSPQPLQGDFFDRVRTVAVAVMIAAGAAVIIGSALDWVSIVEETGVRPNVDFGDNNEFLESDQVSRPFTGLEARYGVYSLVAGVVLIGAAIMLWLRRRGKWAWLGFLASVVIGGLAITSYRAIADTTSPLYEELDIIGRAQPAIGITLVAAGAIIGLVSSVAGVTATPYAEPEEKPA
jgi:cobalamin biosynthesis protein CobD/CbiB